ncbi:hypothetical protein [Corticicoccus populi]|uniref:Uncharacterized protein n=1 Tax=Corticicoccus populi TaxID=1812821 RepID=A0ABW5WYK5_9STAP
MKGFLKKVSIVVLILGIGTGAHLTDDVEAAKKGCSIPCIDFVY